MSPTFSASQSDALSLHFFPGFNQPQPRPVAFLVGTWDERSLGCRCQAFVRRLSILEWAVDSFSIYGLEYCNVYNRQFLVSSSFPLCGFPNQVP